MSVIWLADCWVVESVTSVRSWYQTTIWSWRSGRTSSTWTASTASFATKCWPPAKVSVWIRGGYSVGVTTRVWIRAETTRRWIDAVLQLEHSRPGRVPMNWWTIVARSRRCQCQGGCLESEEDLENAGIRLIKINTLTNHVSRIWRHTHPLLHIM